MTWQVVVSFVEAPRPCACHGASRNAHDDLRLLGIHSRTLDDLSPVPWSLSPFAVVTCRLAKATWPLVPNVQYCSFDRKHRPAWSLSPFPVTLCSGSPSSLRYRAVGTAEVYARDPASRKGMLRGFELISMQYQGLVDLKRCLGCRRGFALSL